MSVVITLEAEEALVIFEFLNSKKIETLMQSPERNAFRNLENALEKEITAIFSADYEELLKAARKSLVDRYGQ